MATTENTKREKTEQIPLETAGRLKRLIDQWRIVDSAVCEMLKIYEEEDSDTQVDIDDVAEWGDAIHLSLDDWSCCIDAMIQRVSKKALEGRRVKALFFDAGWFEGTVIDDPDCGLMLDPKTLQPRDDGSVCILGNACEYHIVV